MKSAAAKTPEEPAEGEDLSALANALRRIVRAIRVSSHTAEEALGISGAQIFVLQQLADHPAASLRELAGRTLTDQSSVSVVVSRLVERKLVARRTSAADKRQIELSLTAAGRELLREAPEPAQARLVNALRKVPARDLRVATKVLTRLAVEMGAEHERPWMFFENEIAATGRKGARRRVE